MSNLNHPPLANQATADTSCRQILREATHDAHVRLNHHPLPAGIVRAGYSRAAYVKVLLAYYHFFRPLEAAIEGYMAGSALDFNYAARRKTPRLAADLGALRVDADDPAWLPLRPLGAIEIMSAAQLVGTRHVRIHGGLAQ